MGGRQHACEPQPGSARAPGGSCRGGSSCPHPYTLTPPAAPRDRMGQAEAPGRGRSSRGGLGQGEWSLVERMLEVSFPSYAGSWLLFATH